MLAYASVIQQSDLTAAGADIQTIAVWVVGVLVSVAAIGFLASVFR